MAFGKPAVLWVLVAVATLVSAGTLGAWIVCVDVGVGDGLLLVWALFGGRGLALVLVFGMVVPRQKHCITAA